MSTDRADQITTDGPYTCARKWHHFFNLCLGALVFGIARGVLLAFGVDAYDVAGSMIDADVMAALIAGPGTLLVSRVVEWVHPTDSQPLTLGQHAADAITDGVCYSGVGTLTTLLVLDPLRAGAASVLFVVAYFRCRPGARP